MRHKMEPKKKSEKKRGQAGELKKREADGD